MADETIHDLSLLTAPANDDEVPVWDLSAGETKRITRANLIGGTLTGNGTVATGGYTLTVPATGTAALLNTANVFTAAQTVIGAAIGAKLAASGNGAAASFVGPQMNSPISVANNVTITVTFAGNGVLMMLDTGEATMLFVTYASPTIIEVGDPSWAVPTYFTVTKSANSRDVVFKNVSGATRNFQIFALGVLTGITVT